MNGVEQKRPDNWSQALKNSSFETSLSQFLAKVWGDVSSSEILRDKVLFLNNDDNCWRYKSVNGCVVTEEVNKMTQECSIIYPAFKVAITSFYKQMTLTVSLLDYQQWKN